jgi:XTP/dITP diphosphohydrolase
VKDQRKVYFLTKNRGKFREAAAVAASMGLRLRMLAATKIEVQSDSLREIASYAAQEAANRLEVPVVAEDAGLFVDKLRGFPGPYSSDVFKRLGAPGILTLMSDVQQRGARFHSAVAFCCPHQKPRCFMGTVSGRINRAPRGTGGFGFDPIFVPTRGDGRTFAQMSVKEKNKISHRAASFRKLSRWLRKRQTA